MMSVIFSSDFFYMFTFVYSYFHWSKRCEYLSHQLHSD